MSAAIRNKSAFGIPQSAFLPILPIGNRHSSIGNPPPTNGFATADRRLLIDWQLTNTPKKSAFGSPQSAIPPARDTAVLTETVSDRLGPPSAPWRGEIEALVARMDAQEARYLLPSLPRESAGAGNRLPWEHELVTTSFIPDPFLRVFAQKNLSDSLCPPPSVNIHPQHHPFRCTPLSENSFRRSQAILPTNGKAASPTAKVMRRTILQPTPAVIASPT